MDSGSRQSSSTDNETSQTSQSSFNVTAPSINLPKVSNIRGIDATFNTSPTGASAISVPIAISPGRSSFEPQLSISYDSNSSNGPYGLGWNLSLPTITRKTTKGLPKYQDSIESDVFILSGAEDLVPVYKKEGKNWIFDDDGNHVIDEKDHNGFRIKSYRPRIEAEGAFARIERWSNKTDPNDIKWRSISKDNITTWYGKDVESRIVNNPDQPTKIFSWLISESYDDKGNAILYTYSRENSAKIDTQQLSEKNITDQSRSANIYIKRIKYGNKISKLIQPDLSQMDWLFEVVFDYGEGHYNEILDAGPGKPQFVNATTDEVGDWQRRQDNFSNCRPTFPIYTYRRCLRILNFHHFKDELRVKDYLVRSTEFIYKEAPVSSLITGIIQSGFTLQEDGTFLKKSLPPVEFKYSEAKIQDKVCEIDADSLENLPQGLDGSQYQWVDLDGEGPGGILTEQAGAWYYKRNLSPLPVKDELDQLCQKVRFAPAESVSPLPSFSSLSNGQQQLLDINGDGRLEVVSYKNSLPGYYERTEHKSWKSFKSFRQIPNINWENPNLKFLDLTGDGKADILITEDQAITWYPSLAEDGFGPAQKIQQIFDEEKGPKIIFADGTDSIYLADMNGDGLLDLVRIRHNTVCYWNNLGYGNFGPKKVMLTPPDLDSPKQFNQKNIRMTDLNGNGLTDIVYIQHDKIKVYINQSGNSWEATDPITKFPKIDNTTNVMIADLMGNGTACLVFSSPQPNDKKTPMKYIDLMGGQKPYLITNFINNLGSEKKICYAPSTKFYLKDKRDGKPWITKLHFPVQVVEKIETYDHISHNHFLTKYTYSHGYFDKNELEFCGFGKIEQIDTEEYTVFKKDRDLNQASNGNPSNHLPPTLTKTWYHTGAYVKSNHISNYFAGVMNASDKGEYYREPGHDSIQAEKLLLEDTIIPNHLTVKEEAEACRALKGIMLRQEIYCLDGTEKAQTPYTVTEQNFTIKSLQPKEKGRHAVFYPHARETINYHYERNAKDPRVQHEMTLEVDNFGNALRSMSIGYGRRAGQSPLEEEEDQINQEQNLIIYTEQNVTKNLISDQENYRTPQLYEICLYEITGLPPEVDTDRYSFKKLTKENFGILNTLEPVDYETPTNYIAQKKRLLEHIRILYRSNDLTRLLGLGDIESLALPGESYKLAYSASMAQQTYIETGKLSLAELDFVFPNEGGYVHSEGDDQWWIPSGQIFFSPTPNHSPQDELNFARNHFFLPHQYRNPFHDDAVPTDSFITYDKYCLLIQETYDILDNKITAGHRKEEDDSLIRQGNNYRTLQTECIMGPNRNCTEVAFDALGFVVATFVMGDPAVQPRQGDVLDDSFRADLTGLEIEAFYKADDPHTLTKDYLTTATTRTIYDTHNFYKSQQAFPGHPEKWEPTFAVTLARETHFSDQNGNENSKVQINFKFFDGFGRNIQTRIQAEPGKVPKRDENGKIIIQENNQPELTNDAVSPRWVCSGWKIFNNKGLPVREYEPFFIDQHKFEFDVKVGVSPYLFYDPLGRMIATLHPNHTWEKTVFSPWLQKQWDTNKTILLDPSTDEDVKGFFIDPQGQHRLPESEYLPSWYEQRTSGMLGPEEARAALKAASHFDTPTTVHLDTLGRPFLTINHNKVECPGHGKDGSDEKYYNRIIQDIEGNQREVIDANDRVVMRYDYNMIGPPEDEEEGTPHLIHQESMEAGERWILNDVAGNPIYTWDSRGHKFRTVYDQLRRPTEKYITGEDSELPDSRVRNKTILVEKIVYGEGQADYVKLNLRGQVYQQYDGAGVVTNVAYDFKGNLLNSNRQLCTDYKNIPDWSLSVDLEIENGLPKLYSSHTTYDALNRPTTLTSPDNSITRPTYNEANLLNSIDVNLQGEQEGGEPKWTSFITNIDYDSRGMRKEIEYRVEDNAGTPASVRTTYHYDYSTYRLDHLKTVRTTDGKSLQDLWYTYDPVGNITNIKDDAQQTEYFNGQVVNPSTSYVFDSMYQLIEAKGREHQGLANQPWNNYKDKGRANLAHPHDGQAMRNYTERYEYDPVGNFELFWHSGGNGPSTWQRRYNYDELSLIPEDRDNQILNNRLTNTTISGGAFPSTQRHYTYDARGNMRSMPQLQTMLWDFQDQMRMSQRQRVNAEDTEGELHQGECTYYVYDAGGQRIRKVTEVNGNPKDERIYLGGFEVYKKHSGENAGLIRETLHIMDDQQRIALIETRIAGDDGSPSQLIRYQFNNHLGSASLELSYNADIIGYEEFYPYGSTSYEATNKDIKAAAKRYKYTGKEKDTESGFYYYGARYYASFLCQWITCDPAGLVDGGNLYCFVKNNPICLVDPDGHQSTTKQEEELGQCLSNAHSEGLESDENLKLRLEEAYQHFHDWHEKHVSYLETEGVGTLVGAKYLEKHSKRTLQRLINKKAKASMPIDFESTHCIDTATKYLEGYFTTEEWSSLEKHFLDSRVNSWPSSTEKPLSARGMVVAEALRRRGFQIVYFNFERNKSRDFYQIARRMEIRLRSPEIKGVDTGKPMMLGLEVDFVVTRPASLRGLDEVPMGHGFLGARGGHAFAFSFGKVFENDYKKPPTSKGLITTAPLRRFLRLEGEGVLIIPPGYGGNITNPFRPR